MWTPFQGFRMFSFNLSSRIGPITTQRYESYPKRRPHGVGIWIMYDLLIFCTKTKENQGEATFRSTRVVAPALLLASFPGLMPATRCQQFVKCAVTGLPYTSQIQTRVLILMVGGGGRTNPDIQDMTLVVDARS